MEQKISKRLLADAMIRGGAQRGSVGFARQQIELFVTCVEDIEQAVLKLDSSIIRSSELSDKLGNRVFWLNVVLAAATVVGAIATAYQVFK